MEIFWRRYFGGRLEKKMEEWRSLENLVERKERKEKGKRKRNEKGKIFSWKKK